jgi:hypothetical protein
MDFVINKVTNIERLLNKRGQSPECKKTSKHITFDFPIRDLPHLETLEKMLEKKDAQLTLVSWTISFIRSNDVFIFSF